MQIGDYFISIGIIQENRARGYSHRGLSIDIFSVADSDNLEYETIFMDRVDYPVVPHTYPVRSLNAPYLSNIMRERFFSQQLNGL